MYLICYDHEKDLFPGHNNNNSSNEKVTESHAYVV